MYSLYKTDTHENLMQFCKLHEIDLKMVFHYGNILFFYPHGGLIRFKQGLILLIDIDNKEICQCYNTMAEFLESK